MNDALKKMYLDQIAQLKEGLNRRDREIHALQTQNAEYLAELKLRGWVNPILLKPVPPKKGRAQ